MIIFNFLLRNDRVTTLLYKQIEPLKFERPPTPKLAFMSRLFRKSAIDYHGMFQQVFATKNIAVWE
jgi:hypothetical protein